MKASAHGRSLHRWVCRHQHHAEPGHRQFSSRPWGFPCVHQAVSPMRSTGTRSRSKGPSTSGCGRRRRLPTPASAPRSGRRHVWSPSPPSNSRWTTSRLPRQNSSGKATAWFTRSAPSRRGRSARASSHLMISCSVSVTHCISQTPDSLVLGHRPPSEHVDDLRALLWSELHRWADHLGCRHAASLPPLSDRHSSARSLMDVFRGCFGWFYWRRLIFELRE